MSGRRNLSKVFFGRVKQTAVETQYLNLEKSRFPLDLKCRFSEKRNVKLPSNLKIIINITTTTTTTTTIIIIIIIIIIILLIKWSSPSFLTFRWKSFFHHLIPARNYSNRCNSIHDAVTWKNISIRTSHWLLQENSPFFSTHRDQSVVQRNVGFSQTNFYYFQSNT